MHTLFHACMGAYIMHVCIHLHACIQEMFMYMNYTHTYIHTYIHTYMKKMTNGQMIQAAP